MKSQKTIPTNNHGFTLIELMIVVAVTAILAAIAIPQYNQYVMRGRVADGLSGLMKLHLKMENYYQDNRVYGAAGVCAYDVTTYNSAYFTYSCASANSDQTFTITATGTGNATGFKYTIDEAATKKTVAVGGHWTGAGSTCWVTRAGGTC